MTGQIKHSQTWVSFGSCLADSVLTRAFSASVAQVDPATEHEPLLGRPGDVTQNEGEGLCRNLVTGIVTVPNVVEVEC